MRSQKNEIRRSDADEGTPTAAANVENTEKDLPNDVITSYAGDTDNEHRKHDYFAFEDSFDSATATTESNDDYFSHDNESVDRLALDGDTKNPLDDFDPFSFWKCQMRAGWITITIVSAQEN